MAKNFLAAVDNAGIISYPHVLFIVRLFVHVNLRPPPIMAFP